MDQRKTPLMGAITEYKQKQTVRLHVPGHKGKVGDWPISQIYPYDVTEIPGLDDLHQPEEAIREAQQLAAEVFGADETYFLVGGSTSGNLAMLLTVCNPGDIILVQRNVHKSVINGLILSQARPVYLMPEIDCHTGLPTTASLKEIEHKLKNYPQAKAVFLSNPNYYGMGHDLTPYAELCEQAGIPLLVDEAHGAHFGLLEDFPPSAMQSGASLAVQSTHKMLPALTMASMLHVRGERINRNRLKQVLAMIQSSSPSYPIMSFLDMARSYIAFDGKRALAQAKQYGERLTTAIRMMGIAWLEVVQWNSSNGYMDPLKITLRSQSSQLHGFALKEYLENRGIFPELADQHHVLLILSPMTTGEEIDRIIEVLRELQKYHGQEDTLKQAWPAALFSSEMVFTPHEAFYRSAVSVPFEEAVGSVCAEMVVPYPPGIPAINPGERLDPDTMSYIKQLQRLGCRFHGCSDSTLGTIQIIQP